jgi:ribosomal-protein-alanine N-acetyltransferase
MSAMPEVTTRLVPMTEAKLDEVMAIEQMAYSHPWTRGNFLDSLRSGYRAEVLLSTGLSDEKVIGYFVAMPGVEEMHLLNITVSPVCQGQGWGQILLQAVVERSRQCLAQWLWLEVRASNLRALSIYQRFGFRRVGERKGYYPLSTGQREDAIVMSLLLTAPARGASRSAP